MLISPQALSQFHAFMRGAHYPALKDDHVRALRIPELTRIEQDELVGMLDSLSEQIGSAAAGIEAYAQRLVAESKLGLPSLLADAYGFEAIGEDFAPATAAILGNPVKGGL